MRAVFHDEEAATAVAARLRGDGSVDRSLKGMIDELRLFPAALNAGDIAELYAMHLPD